MDEDDSKPAPLAFANQVIEALAANLLGSRIKPNRRGYRNIRVVFRKLGGSWFELCQGNPVHVELLLETISAWGVCRTVSK